MHLEILTSEELRIIRAKYDDFYFENIDFDNSSAITIGSKEKYNTTLNSCTCQDFQKRRKPCKHIYRLSYKLGKFDLYDNPEQEEIAIKINLITDLITAEKLKDIYYRKRDHKDKYSLQKNMQTTFLENIGLIRMYEVPLEDRIINLYKVLELKELLNKKYDIKGLKKQELVQIFANDEELVSLIPPTDEYRVDLLITNKNKDFFIECLNYRIYNQLQHDNDNDYEDKSTNLVSDNHSEHVIKIEFETPKVYYQPPELSEASKKLLNTGQKYVLAAVISILLSIVCIVFLLPAVVLMLIALIYFIRAAIQQNKK